MPQISISWKLIVLLLVLQPLLIAVVAFGAPVFLIIGVINAILSPFKGKAKKKDQEIEFEEEFIDWKEVQKQYEKIQFKDNGKH